MRGKVPITGCLAPCVGITPAYAGKRFSIEKARRGDGDHPRICGEKHLTVGRLKPVKGSPPHMRGKAKRYCEECAVLGITPAYAGKRILFSSSLSKYGDHPRICGEKLGVGLILISIGGSPPHMRGKELVGTSEMSTNGITPAYAGKRLPRWPFRRPSWDHPRICGEKPETTSR